MDKNSDLLHEHHYYACVFKANNLLIMHNYRINIIVKFSETRAKYNHPLLYIYTSCCFSGSLVDSNG